MQHQIRRWDHDHTAELHSAWMNGSGMMVWENVFGSWVPWNPRDRSILRSMLPIQRRFTALFSGEAWTPLVPVRQTGIFASLWEGHGLRLWTLVNRTSRNISGALLQVPALAPTSLFRSGCRNGSSPHHRGRRRRDCPARSRPAALAVFCPALISGFGQWLRALPATAGGVAGQERFHHHSTRGGHQARSSSTNPALILVCRPAWWSCPQPLWS